MTKWRTTKITIKRGKVKVSPKQHKLLIARRLPHTHQKTDGRGHKRYVRTRSR